MVDSQKSILVKLKGVDKRFYNPLSEENVSIAIKKATAYGFDAKILKTAIETLQDRLLNEEA